MTQSMQKVVPAAGCDQQSATEQGHQRMGLPLKAFSQGDSSYFKVVDALASSALIPG